MPDRLIPCPTESNVFIGRGLLGRAGAIVESLADGVDKALIAFDSALPASLPIALKNSLENAGIATCTLSLRGGEGAKTFANVDAALRLASSRNLSRRSAFVALGGGTISDLVGFCAAIYRRGARWVVCPTTVTAGIDAAVGGKTGINLGRAKNRVGAFLDPVACLFDLDALDSLPDSEFRNGMAEGAKCGILFGGEIADLLDGGDSGAEFERFCELCVSAKLRLVRRDRCDFGERRLLNLGHAISDAVEALSGYSIPHGAAVAYGLKRMADAALKANDLGASEHARIISWLTRRSRLPDARFSDDSLLRAIRAHNRCDAEGIDAVAIRGIGRCEIARMTFEEFGEYVA